MLKKTAIAISVIGMLLLGSVSWSENKEAEEREFQQHKQAWVQSMRQKISCIQGARNWDQWERCHHEAEAREKRRKLEHLKEEERRLKEEMKKLRVR